MCMHCVFVCCVCGVCVCVCVSVYGMCGAVCVFVCVRAHVSMEVGLYLKWHTLRQIRTLGRNIFSVVFF